MKRRRALVLAAVAAVLGLSLLPMVSMADALPLDSYGATAESYGLDVQVVAIAEAGTIPDLADEYFPHTKAEVDSLPHSAADGEFFDPGATVRIGPNLGNNLLLGPHGVPPVIPNYPYIASTTSDPSNPRDVERNTTGPQTVEPGLPTVGIPSVLPTGFGVGVSHAHADATPYADATGAVHSTNLGLVTIGTVSGESSAKQASGVVTATTTATMSDIKIATVLHIASTTVTASIQTSGPGTVKTTQDVTFSGVTVAGIPATIDKDGLRLNGSPLTAGLLAATMKQLTNTLASVGFKMVAPHTTATTNSDGSATVNVDGFGLSYTDGKNVSAAVTLGHAAVKARALPGTPITDSSAATQAATVGTFDNGYPGFTETLPFDNSTSAAGGRRVIASTLVSGGGGHMLILPFVAVVAELSMILLVVRANRWRKQAQEESPQALLAL